MNALTNATGDMLIGVAQSGLLLDMGPAAGSRTARKLFASFDAGDDDAVFRAAVLLWKPDLCSRAEIAALAGDIPGFAADPAARHYFELLRP